jgi:hypothetical protein
VKETTVQQAGRVDSSLQEDSVVSALGYVDEGEDMINRIVTGDKSWVHHYQPELKCVSWQWKHPIFNQKAQSLRLHHQLGRLCLLCFGLLRECGENVNSASYCEVRIKPQDAIRRKHPGSLARGILLHHDNARLPTAWATQEAIQELQQKLLDYLPYSLDSAASDFHLLCPLKKSPWWQKFC